MATSIGAAAAQGIESGLGLGLQVFDRQRQMKEREEERGLRLQDREDMRADRELQRQRGVKQDERLDEQAKRSASIDALKMLDSEIADLTNEGTALFSQYGGYDKVPEDVRGEYTGRVRTARQRRAQARQQFYEPTIVEQKRDAAEKWSRIQAGQLDVDDLPDDELVKTLTIMSRRDLSDFISPEDGSPSKIQQAGLDLQAGLETGNMDLTLKAANVLLQPELRTGIGTDGMDGNEIVGKEIVKLVPDPRDPSRFVPVVKVTVKRDDGALGSYMAPITEGRSSDPADNVKTISMQEAFDRVGQLTTLGEALNRPDVRKRIEKGREAAGGAPEEFLQALASIGVKAPTKQTSTKTVDLGDRVLEQTLDAGGNIVSERNLRKGAAPRAGGLGGGGGTAAERNAAAEDRRLAEAVKSGVITEAEAKEAKRRKVLGIKPADEARNKKANDKQLAQRNAAIQQADRLIGKVDSALKKVGGWTTGLGSALSRIPGTDAKDLAAELETIKANLGFAELQAMREASPTGGALGAIAVQELTALQSTVASLDQKQSPEQLRESLTQIRAHYNKWKQATIDAAAEEDAEPNDGGGAEMEGGPEPMIAVNPTTGERIMWDNGQWVPAP